jgi:transcriptional regulator with XRE-family HTH domain
VNCGLPETGLEDRHVKTVGSYLQEVRESRGIQLEEAARITRIGKNYLIAIEGEMFEKLPNSAYVKGFLRVYAGFLGLPGDEIVAMFDKSLSPQQIQPPRNIGKDEPSERIKARLSRPGRWLPLLLLMGAIVVAVYLSGDKGVQTDNTPPAPIVQHQIAALPLPVQPIRTSAVQHRDSHQVVADLQNNQKPVSGGVQHQSGIILRLKVSQDCWLNITIDDAISQQYDLKAGDLIEWKADKVFALDIGNAGGIEAEFNGKPLKPFGELGKTAHVILKGEGI